MNRLSLYLFVSIALMSCNNQEQKIVREGEPDVYQVNSDDRKMNEAKETAMQTLDKFDEALNSGDPAYDGFLIKVGYDTPDSKEHIWINNIVIKDGEYWGTVANEPVNVSNLSYGDTVKIEKSRISDWRYVEDGKLRGGYTIRVLRNKMTPEERRSLTRKWVMSLEE